MRASLVTAIIALTLGCGATPPPDHEWPAGFDPTAEMPADGKVVCDQPEATGNEPEATLETLSRPHVQDGMAPIDDNLYKCNFENVDGTIQIMITIANNGRVEHAAARGDWRGTLVGWCGAQLFCDLEFPRFQKPSLTVLYPFKLRKTKRRLTYAGDPPNRPTGAVYCGTPDDPQPADGPVIAKPSKQQIEAEMQALIPEIEQCFDRGDDSIELKIVVGKSGRPTQIEALGGYDTSQQGHCASEKACQARFPRLERKHTFEHEFELVISGDGE